MELLPLPPFQETLNAGACAPATLKMLLMHFNLPGQEKADMELAPDLGHDPQLGVSNDMFVAALPKYGLKAEVIEQASFDDIGLYLNKKMPVVVDWFSPGRNDKSDSDMGDGHYSIVIGLTDSHIYLQDPETGTTREIKRKDFYRVWFDFKHEHITTWDDMVIRWMAAISKV